MPLRTLLAGIAVALSPFAATAQVARADSAHAFNVAYTGDVWHNIRGGLQTGTGYVDNLDVQLSIDGEVAWGIEGLTLFGYLVHNSGGMVSRDLVGDAQAISVQPARCGSGALAARESRRFGGSELRTKLKREPGPKAA